MTQNILAVAKGRHTVKAYDPSRKIPDETIEQLKELLRISPSSTNLQPWHFIIASTDAGKDRVAKSTDTLYPFNSPSIRNASHVVVFASRLSVDEQYLQHVLEEESQDGRFDADKDTHKAKMHAGRSLFVNLHKQDFKDVQHWMDKQVYLNMGHFLLGAAALGVDSTPMEGIDIAALDEEFGLREKGFSSLAVVCLGYLDPANDYNADLPKSRLELSEIMTEV